MAGFDRRKRLEGMTYDSKKLNDLQVEKLITDIYNLDFLGPSSPGKKFKRARQNIKMMDQEPRKGDKMSNSRSIGLI